MGDDQNVRKARMGTYSMGDPALDRVVDELVALAGGPDGDLGREMITSVLKLLRDRAERMNLKIVNAAMKELRHAFRVFAPWRMRRKVSIFGSARSPEESPEYALARRFADLIADEGFMVITGAGGGIMSAGHQGAGRERSFGVNIRLPFEQAANPFIDRDPKLINFKYFFTRKLIFVKETDAIVLFPGGFGTLDEGFESMTLVQTGKTDPLPIVCMDAPGGSYWQDLDAVIRKNLLDRRYISEDDVRLYRITDSAEEAAAEIVRFYGNYQSQRYVRDRLVMRLRRAPSPEELERLNRDFADICARGRIEVTPPLPEEADEPDSLDLQRIVLDFDRRHFGRHRQLIDALNNLPVPAAAGAAAARRSDHGFPAASPTPDNGNGGAA